MQCSAGAHDDCSLCSALHWPGNAAGPLGDFLPPNRHMLLPVLRLSRGLWPLNMTLLLDMCSSFYFTILVALFGFNEGLYGG